MKGSGLLNLHALLPSKLTYQITKNFSSDFCFDFPRIIFYFDLGDSWPEYRQWHAEQRQKFARTEEGKYLVTNKLIRNPDEKYI
jgi:hypothetical protein